MPGVFRHDPPLPPPTPIESMDRRELRQAAVVSTLFYVVIIAVCGLRICIGDLKLRWDLTRTLTLVVGVLALVLLIRDWNRFQRRLRQLQRTPSE